MSENIIVALISAGSAIIVAIIGLFAKRKSDSKGKTKITQKMGKGNDNTQIGIQNNYGEKEDKK